MESKAVVSRGVGSGNFLWGVFLIMVLMTAAASAQVVLNEVMAENLTTLPNGNDFPDWVELYNPTSLAVDLGGWSLTDNLTQSSKYVFSSGTFIQPGQFLIVYCDGNTNSPGIHTGFGLDANGELVALYSPANPFSPREIITFGHQLPDRSLGRVPDGTGGWLLNVPTPTTVNQAATTGALTNLFINEWMADDSPDDDWLELYNDSPSPVGIGGLIFTDSLGVPNNTAVPNYSFIPGNGFLQFWADDNADQGFGHLDFKLSAGGETVTLYQSDRFTVVNRVVFGSQIQSVSQGRLPDGNTNIVFFPVGRDTPAASNLLPLTNVVVNEVLSHTDPPLEDAIELANVSGVPVDIGHWWLSDSKSDPKKFRIPAGTILPAGGFKVFYEYQFNPDFTGNSPSFSYNSSQGDDAYIHTGDATGKLTGYRGGLSFGSAENAVSFGRYTNSQGEVEFVPMSQRSFGVDDATATMDQFRTGLGKANPRPRVGPIVIREIMYHPPDLVTNANDKDNLLDEYIELYNITNVTVNLYDPAFPTNRWKFVSGIDYTLPTGMSLAPGKSLLLVNFNPTTNPAQLAAFRAKYNVPAAVQILGAYGGKLDNRSEALFLQKPDTPQGPEHPDFGYVPYLYAERVEYEDGDPWPTGADGEGLALHRIQPEAYGNDATNWVAAVPTPGWDLIRIEDIAVAPSGVVILRIPVVINASYTVQYRASLASGSWTKLTDLPAQSATGTADVTDTTAPVGGRRWYRIVSPMQP